MIHLVIVIVLSLPLLWELNNDRNGEWRKDKARDVAVRCFLFLACSSIWLFQFHWLVCLSMLFLSSAIHFFLFDYLVVLVLRKRKVIDPDANWFSYMGEESLTDNISWWRSDPWLRLSIKILYLLSNLCLYAITLDLTTR